MVPALRPSRYHRPCSAARPNGATSAAARPMRIKVTAPGLQPVSRRPRASVPESPNDAADNNAKPSPLMVRGATEPGPAAGLAADLSWVTDVMDNDTRRR